MRITPVKYIENEHVRPFSLEPLISVVNSIVPPRICRVPSIRGAVTPGSSIAYSTACFRVRVPSQAIEYEYESSSNQTPLFRSPLALVSIKSRRTRDLARSLCSSESFVSCFRIRAAIQNCDDINEIVGNQVIDRKRKPYR